MPFETKSRYLQQFEPKLSQLGNDGDLWWVVPFSVRYIVGVAGCRFAGTSTALSYLGEKLGFKVYSLSNELRDIARHQGVPLNSRKRLQDLGDELRAERDDPGYLARLTLQRIRADQLRWPESRARIAVGGFKHPKEVEIFKQLQGFHLLRLDVGQKVRHERAKDSGMWEVEQEGSRRSLKLFQSDIDQRDRDGRNFHSWTGQYGQWVDGVMQSEVTGKKLRSGNFSRGKLFQELVNWVAELDEEHQNPELAP